MNEKHTLIQLHSVYKSGLFEYKRCSGLRSLADSQSLVLVSLNTRTVMNH